MDSVVDAGLIRPTRTHRDTIEALAATVRPPAYGRYPEWVRDPQTEAQFIAALVIHSRDGHLPKGYRPIVPMCDPDGYVTALPLRIKQ